MSSPLPSMDWSRDQRASVHAAFNDWILICTEEDYQKVSDLYEQVASGEIGSMVKLIQACYARADLLANLPDSLLQRLIARNLPPPSFDAKAGEG